MAYLLLYVDDIVLTAANPVLIARIISKLSMEFAISDLGPLHHFLGTMVTHDNGSLYLSQTQYACDYLSS